MSWSDSSTSDIEKIFFGLGLKNVVLRGRKPSLLDTVFCLDGKKTGDVVRSPGLDTEAAHVCVCVCVSMWDEAMCSFSCHPHQPLSRSPSWSQSDPQYVKVFDSGVWGKVESVRSGEHVSQQRLTFVFNVLSHRKQQGRWPPCGAEREVLGSCVLSLFWRPSARPLMSVTLMQHTLKQFGQLPFLAPFTGTKSVSKWTEQILHEVDRENRVISWIKSNCHALPGLSC